MVHWGLKRIVCARALNRCLLHGNKCVRGILQTHASSPLHCTLQHYKLRNEIRPGSEADEADEAQWSGAERMKRSGADEAERSG